MASRALPTQIFTCLLFSFVRHRTVRARHRAVSTAEIHNMGP